MAHLRPEIGIFCYRQKILPSAPTATLDLGVEVRPIIRLLSQRNSFCGTQFAVLGHLEIPTQEDSAASWIKPEKLGKQGWKGIPMAKEVSIDDQLRTLVEDFIRRGVRYVEAMSVLEKQFIRKVLGRNNGNQSKAAKILGMHRNTLSRKIDNLGLQRDSTQPRKSGC